MSIPTDSAGTPPGEPEVRKIRIREEPESVPGNRETRPNEPSSRSEEVRSGEDPLDGSLLNAVPGLAKIAAAAAWRTTAWTAGLGVRAGTRVIESAAAGESAGELFERAEEEIRGYVGGLVGALQPEVEEGGSGGGRHRGEAAPAETSTDSLREQGAELLRRSADVGPEEKSHPAYARILEAIAPDEARILRLLALEGEQPSVDVRSGLPVNVGSQLIAPGLSMIGAEAGCRHLDRVNAYLNNLFRLGLIWFSREPVADPLRYQVVEAQPEVTDALRKAGRLGRTVRRSVHLTPFGQDFCDTCLPLHTSEFGALGRKDPGIRG